MKGLCRSLERKNVTPPWFCGTADVLLKLMCKGRVEKLCAKFIPSGRNVMIMDLKQN